MDNTIQYFTLTDNDATNPYLEVRDLGPDNELGDDGVHAWVGQRPVVIRIDPDRQHGHASALLPGLSDEHEIWLVLYSFGLQAMRGIRQVCRLVFEARYDPEPAVTIFDVFPQTRHAERGDAEPSVEISIQLSDSLLGAFGTDVPIPGLPGGVDGSLKVGAKLSLSLRSMMAVPVITAAGKLHDRGIWEFQRHDTALAGDYVVGHLLLVRKPLEPADLAVNAQVRLSVHVGPFGFWASPRSTSWVSLRLQPTGNIVSPV